MKKTLALICAMTVLLQIGYAQKQPPYNFPENAWKIEKSNFPLSFAPSIAYKGTDEIRFLPGFENAQSNNYFSYCFLWYLDGGVKFTEDQLKNDLIAYYNGLGKLTNGTKVNVKKVTPATNYKQAFSFVIHTTDNLYTHKNLDLNGNVNIANCNGGNSTIAFFAISPKPATDEVWADLNKVRDGVTWAK